MLHIDIPQKTRFAFEIGIDMQIGLYRLQQNGTLGARFWIVV